MEKRNNIALNERIKKHQELKKHTYRERKKREEKERKHINIFNYC